MPPFHPRAPSCAHTFDSAICAAISRVSIRRLQPPRRMSRISLIRLIRLNLPPSSPLSLVVNVMLRIVANMSYAWTLAAPLPQRLAHRNQTITRFASTMAHTKPAPAHISTIRNADPNAVAVVVGASRGIGLAMVQNLVKRWKGSIVATCRDVESAGALSALWQFMPHRLTVIPMDVCDEKTVRHTICFAPCLQHCLTLFHFSPNVSV